VKGVVFMTTANPIESNSVDISGVAATSARNSVSSTGSGFDGVMGALGQVAYYGGGTGVALSDSMAPNSTEIVAAAVNATAGYAGGTGMMTTAGTYSGATSNYYGTGTSALGTAGSTTLSGTTGTTSDDMLGMAQEQLAASQASSVAMLMVQDEMGTQNRLYTSASNLMNSRDTMLSSIIRNVRVG